MPQFNKEFSSKYAVRLIYWMQSILNQMNECPRNEWERINLWFLVFNKLSELWMYAVNVLLRTKSNQIRVLNARTRIRILFTFVAFECQNYHKHAFNFRCNRLVWVSTVHLGSLWWKVMFKCVCNVHCKQKGCKLLW